MTGANGGGKVIQLEVESVGSGEIPVTVQPWKCPILEAAWIIQKYEGATLDPSVADCMGVACPWFETWTEKPFQGGCIVQTFERHLGNIVRQLEILAANSARR